MSFKIESSAHQLKESDLILEPRQSRQRDYTVVLKTIIESIFNGKTSNLKS
jgi:hypothetical protein